MVLVARRMVVVAATTLCLTLLAALALGSVASAATFTRGFADDVWFNRDYTPWMARTVASGAKVVKLEVDWSRIEPKAPATSSNTDNPANRAYSFGYLDDVTREFQNTGVKVLFMITDAPRWAEGRGGTQSELATGGWMPNTTALKQFMTAISRRYSGTFEVRGKRLPRVGYFQAWAEANLDQKLSPQWERSGQRWVNVGATIYRRLVNSFYAGVKTGDRSAKVLFSGLAPYGDVPGRARVSPVTFLRNVLCLGNSLRSKTCSQTTYFDILASDPYDVGAPTTHAFNSNDASAPDMGRLTRVANAAVREHTLLPAIHKSLWITEFSYDSNPPNPHAPSTATQARWLEQSFYVFWKEGASTVIWYLIADQGGHSYATDYFSGVFRHSGKAKPSLTAFRFPLVVMADGGHSQFWGIAPTAGTVQVQRHAGSAWKTVRTFRRAKGAIFSGLLPRGAHGSYRAVLGKTTSLVWKY